MSLELDWLEREERYRRRVNRLITVFVIVVGAILGTAAYLRSRDAKEVRQAAARAAEQQKQDAERSQRAKFVADSTAAANRWAGFLQAHQAKPLQELPFIEIPLPPGRPVRPFVESLWTEYVRVVDPEATSSEEITWYRQNFIGILNDGPMRGRAVLLPLVDQSGTKLDIRKSSFTQITKAQVEIGMREPPEEAPADSLAGLLPQAAPAGGEGTPPATEPSSTPPASSTAGGTTEAPSGQPAAEPPPAASGTPPQPAPAPEPGSAAATPAPGAPAPAAPAPAAPAAAAPAPAAPAPAAPAPDTSAPKPPSAPQDTVPKP